MGELERQDCWNSQGQHNRVGEGPMAMERRSEAGQTTVIPHSEAFIQIPDGQTGKNYLHGDSQASGETTPAV